MLRVESSLLEQRQEAIGSLGVVGALCCGICSNPLRFQRVIVVFVIVGIQHTEALSSELANKKALAKMPIVHLYLLVSVTFVCSWVCLWCI